MKLMSGTALAAIALALALNTGCKREANERTGTTKTTGAPMDESQKGAAEKTKPAQPATGTEARNAPPSEGTLQVKIRGRAPQTVDYALKNDKIRLGLSSTPNNPKEGIDAIIDTTDHTATLLMNDQKTYAEVDLDKLAAIERQAVKELPKMKLTKTGKTDTVAGMSCEELRLESDQYDVTACAMKGKRKMVDLAALEKSASFSAPQWLTQLIEEGYMPLRVVVKEKGAQAGATPVASTQVTDFSRHPVPDTEFAIPKGYSKTTLPGLPEPKSEPEHKAKTK